MKTKIDSEKLYWASFNRFEMRMPGEAVEDIAQSGTNGEMVAHWAPKVSALCESDGFANRPTPDKIRAELKEYGAWDAEELSDDAANWLRLVWTAAWNIAEDEAPDCSEPVAPQASHP